MGIKLANTKYELNRLQREHIKLQLEQEKFLENFESLSKSSEKQEERKLPLNEKSEALNCEEEMDSKEKVNAMIPHGPRVTISK